MLSTLITLLVFLLVVGLFWWVLQQIPLPAPIKQISTVILVVVCAIYLIYMLLGLAHGGAIDLH